MDAEPLHDGEARPVDDREALVGEGLPDGERHLEICGDDGLDQERAVADCAPLPLRGGESKSARHERPQLDEHVVGGDESIARGEDLNRPNVGAVVEIGRREED